MNYEVEQKRHWRYWVWKRIAENCGVHPSFATVLFLSGPSPSDLQAATKYGFKLRNIVAVDMNAECVEAARKAGCTAIQGSLHEVVTKWSDGQIHGVVADYCCGLTIDVAIESFHIASVVPSVAFNFQRGRESDACSRLLRETFDVKDRALLMKMFMNTVWLLCDYTLRSGGPDPKGFVQCVADAAAQYSSSEKEVREKRSVVFAEYFKLAVEAGVLCKESMLELMSHPAMSQIATCSYRSNKVVMDSVVGSFKGCDGGIRENWRTPRRTSVDRRLAATKAIRTMNGAVKMHASQN